MTKLTDEACSGIDNTVCVAPAGVLYSVNHDDGARGTWIPWRRGRGHGGTKEGEGEPTASA